MNQLLEGKTILNVSQAIATPVAGTLLAGMGARVIKVQDPNLGDPSREQLVVGDDSIYYHTVNVNQDGMALNFKSKAGQAVFRRMISSGKIDGVISGMLNRVNEKFGINYATLGQLHAPIVVVALTGWGPTGPMANAPGFDHLVQGTIGVMEATGSPGHPPIRAPWAPVDYCAGVVAAYGMVCGMLKASQTGTGCDIDASLLDTGLAMMTYLGTGEWNTGGDHGRLWHFQNATFSSHPSAVPFQVVRAADRWMWIGALKQGMWERLCKLLNRPDLLEDESFKTPEARRQNPKKLMSLLWEIIKEKKAADWVNILMPDVPAAQILKIHETPRHEQVVARESIVEVPDTPWGDLKVAGAPFRVNGERLPVRRAPEMDEHTRDVVCGVCGVSETDFEQFVTDGAFSASPETAKG